MRQLPLDYVTDCQLSLGEIKAAIVRLAHGEFSPDVGGYNRCTCDLNQENSLNTVCRRSDSGPIRHRQALA